MLLNRLKTCQLEVIPSEKYDTTVDKYTIHAQANMSRSQYVNTTP